MRTLNKFFYLYTYLLVEVVKGEVCKQLNNLGRLVYKTCKTGCCGDIHKSYCCIHKHLGAIVIGNVLGVFVLLAFVAAIVNWCKRRQQQPLIEYKRVTRKYGTFPKPDDVNRPESSPATSTTTDKPARVVVPEVDITVTPATADATVLESPFLTEIRPKSRQQE